MDPASIRRDLSLRLNYTVDSRDAYVAAAQSLPDALTEYFFLLQKHGAEANPWLWVLSLRRMCQLAADIAAQETELLACLDVDIVNARAAMAPLVASVRKLCVGYFRAPRRVDADLFPPFVALCHACLDMVIAALRPEPLLSAIVHAVGEVGGSACAETQPPAPFAEPAEPQPLLFPVLVKIARAAFFGGAASAVLPLVFEKRLVSEHVVPKLWLCDEITLPLVIDFYRLYAYCLVSAAVEDDDPLQKRLTQKADIFLKVLLHIPSLHLANYHTQYSASPGLEPDEPARVLSPPQREEVSFFFLLNCLLRMDNLAQLVSPDKHFVAESGYFLLCFNKRTTTDLSHSASRSSSRSASVVSSSRNLSSLSALSPNAEPEPPGRKILSAILTEGSYKERLKLVAGFFSLFTKTNREGSLQEIVHTFGLRPNDTGRNDFLTPEASDVVHIYNRIDRSSCPGKMLYMRAVDKIVRLVQLLSVAYLAEIVGPNVSAAEILRHHFNSNYPVSEILSVKALLVSGDNITRAVTSVTDDARIAGQLELLDITRGLERSAKYLL